MKQFMEEINIFKDAKFGDKFINEMGEIGLFLFIDDIKNKAFVILEGQCKPFPYNLNGRWYDTLTSHHDIISKYN